MNVFTFDDKVLIFALSQLPVHRFKKLIYLVNLVSSFFQEIGSLFSHTTSFVSLQ